MTPNASESSAHGLMMSAQYCWPRGFSWFAEVKSKSMCLRSERICQDHIHRSAGIKWESPNFTGSWPSLSLHCLSYRFFTHYCHENKMYHKRESTALSRKKKKLGNVHNTSAADLACKSEKKRGFWIQNNQPPLWVNRQDSRKPQVLT